MGQFRALLLLACVPLWGCGSSDDSSSSSGGASASGGKGGTSMGGSGGTSTTGGTGGSGGAGTGGTGGTGGVPPTGNAWYVSTSGDNSDGKSWATAWKELDQIGWSSIEPGDRIEVDAGTYKTRLVPDKGGSAAGRITLERSTEAGHDGKVIFDFSSTPVPEYWAGQVSIKQPYLTIDGKDWNQFQMIGGSSCLVIVDNGEDADFFELRNVKLEGQADPENGGAALCIFSGSIAMDHVWFGKQIGAEDHIKLVTTSHSSLKVEHSVFTPWVSINGSHADLIEQCWPGCDAGDLVFKRNLIWDSGPGGENLVFTLDPHWASVDVSYNVFLDTSGVFQFTTQGSQRISNNVFYNVGGTFGGDETWECVNNVFVAPPSNTNIVWGSTPKYSLWGPGTYGYFSGGGTNIQADPIFVDPTNPLGADGIPFTDDDGFNLKAGSPAINKGKQTVDATDIREQPISGAPDIGAYEHP